MTLKTLSFLTVTAITLLLTGQPVAEVHADILFQQQDTVRTNRADTARQQPYRPSFRPTFQLRDRYGDPFSNTTSKSPLFLKDPTKVGYEIQLDSSLNYTIYEKVGDLNYRPVTSMSFEEFKAYQDRQMLKSYWQGKSRSLDGESAVSGRSLIPKLYVSPILDRIFGGSYVELVPRGFVTLDFGVAFQRIDNPNIPIRQQRNGGFEFDQQINMSVIGKVGEKLAVSANFDNNNSFDFQNNMKVEYTGFKEDILKKLEIGNVSLPLNNTLIQGSQNLFGVKAQLQFGKLFVTTVASTQRGKVASIELPGGNSGQGRPFELVASGYDENRHFFLGHFFRDNFERWLGNPPQIYSGINITRVEVYILNRNNDTRTLRNVVGLMDLGEPRRVYNSSVTGLNASSPNANEANELFNDVRNFTSGPNGRDADGINALLDNYFDGEGNNGTDYEKITGARILNPTEYTFHKQLGYITLTRKLQNDEALAVAYEFTYNGRSYKVGELSEDYASRPDNEVLFLKLLRPRKVSIRDQQLRIIPTWDLMMKNIYSLNVSQLTPENFQLRIIYRDDRSGIDNPQLQEGQDVRNRQLIEVFGLDKLNPVNDPQRDGNFDFVEGVTINTQAGIIIFPFLEPFSKALRDAFENDPQESFLIQKYAFDTLYRTTRADAELIATKNKFWLVGTYSAGSSKEILIPGFGVSQGSVRVYAGGTPLMEGTDYTVDYTFGRVTILSDAILSSGKNISIQYEQSDPFAFQTRSLLGTRFDYQVNDNLSLGSTVLYYNERPLITRNAIGTEPARNLQYGLDFNYRKDSRLITKLIDAIPGVQTKELSSINWSGEFAQLLPGTSNIVDDEGTGYIDDFENTATPYSLMSPQAWKLAATPKDPDFDLSDGIQNDLRAGFRRAKLAWYIVDNQFYRDGGQFKPANISSSDLENHYVRAIQPTEIFPNRIPPQGNFWEPVLDIAYYPTERGPYNYDTLRLGSGKTEYTPLEAPDNWAGLTTAIRTEVDFDKANIEYVEFWMLDPFINNSDRGRIIDGKFNNFNTTGGKLIFHLGSISEDVIRDGKHGFENGLPPDGNLAEATQTPWGYVTNRQYITNAFDNSATARANQDVGWDGIGNENERTKYSSFVNLDPEFALDPSADDFQFYFGNELDARDAQILERYKNYNGLENNTPINTGSDIPRSNGFLPDNEDLNADNTLNELEEYYQYSIELEPGDLDIGKHYIVDKITPARLSETNNNPDGATWYLFRIPVRNFEERVGNIEGFKSIRYVRMILTEFQQPVVLRMANFRLIGSRWRRYLENLEAGGLVPDPEPDFDNFTLSVVNIEENSAPDPASGKPPYVLPPGFIRDRDNTSSVYRELNEQSVQVCIENLKDGDARAIYKNVTMDFFNYGRIKMFVHANSINAQDDDLTVFMRLGTDFNENFYEVELPLKITPGSASAASDIWPSANEFDFALKDLYGLKARRDREGASLDIPFPAEGPSMVGRHGLRVVGRPDLSQVQLIMIGVRNPRTNDVRSYSVCVWANELRLTDFDRTAGYAFNTSFNAKLADFATVSGSMRYMTYGFGSVSSKISERTREETFAYDVTANVNIDKLLPGNHGIKIPMLVSYQNTTINPNYDPANPDQKLDAALASFNTQQEKDDYVKLIRDREVRRSLNFTNVRKTKVNPEANTHLWDIENLSFSYRYSDNVRRSFTIAESLRKDIGGSVAYNFSPKGAGFEPFKNSDGFKSPWFKFIKDFNFSLLPSSIMVRGDLDRSFSKIIYRNSLSNSESNYLKYFTFNRTYNVQWNLTKSLTLNYSSRANAIIDEPEGDIDTQEKRDSLMNNLKRFGRMKNFDQTITANYVVPLDKFPLTDWVGAEYRYQVNYNWKAGPIDQLDLPGEVRGIPDSLNFRNTIQNSRDQTLSGRLDLVKLYNKIGFLKNINSPPRPATTRPQPNQKADTVKTPTTPPLVKGLLRLLMSVRSINGTYTVTEGTMLPGFEPTPHLFGLTKGFDAPGWDFVLGGQSPGIRTKAAENNWLVRSTSLTIPFTQTSTKSLTGRANIEPSPDLKIQLDIKKDVTDGYQEIFRFDDMQNNYISLNPSRYGSYKISTLSINTAFRSDNDELVSSVFQQFEENLLTVQQRFAAVNPGFEYDSISQDVVIPAFISAYTGKSAEQISLSPFPRTPFPSWRVDYNGLNKIEAFKDIFQSITITHGYSSTYSVLNFSNSLQYENPGDVGFNVPIEKYNNGIFSNLTNDNGRPIPIYVISQVLIAEQFSPLIGVNLRTKNRLTARAEYKTKRELALNIANAQVTEVSSKDVTVEIGYTKNNMKLPIKSQGRTIVLKNDVTFRMNMTISNQSTIQRKIEELNVLTNGNINFQLRPNISYVVNQKLNVQAYFERTINDPQVSNSFRRATTRFGFQVRFSLAQ